MPRARRFALSCIGVWLDLCLALSIGLCLQREARAGTASVEGSIENVKNGDRSSARLTLKGSVPKWPDGAKASVKLSVKEGADVDWYDLSVKGGAFEGKIDFANKKSAAIVYRAELWLRVGIQLPDIKAWFQREYAVSKDHAELVEACDIAFGTPDEQKQFHADTVKKCADLIARARANLEKAAAAVDKAKDADAWKLARAPVEEEARKLQEEYLSLLKRYVSIGRDARLLFSVNNATLAAFKVVSQAEDDPDGARATAEEAKQAAEKTAEAVEKARSECEGAKPGAPPAEKDGKAPPEAPKAGDK